MISIVDYGLGNVRAFENIFRKLGINSAVVSTAAELAAADKIILPGVGAFDWAMKKLNDSGMVPVLNKKVLDDKVPVLGVCVGMQIMGVSSEEGVADGLGWIQGKVLHLDLQRCNGHLPLPHMGWNTVNQIEINPLLDGLDGDDFYFLHSYYFEPEFSSNSLAKSEYGREFVCAINHENIYATQFHPEKSHEQGVKLLKNFAEVC